MNNAPEFLDLSRDITLPKPHPMRIRYFTDIMCANNIECVGWQKYGVVMRGIHTNQSRNWLCLDCFVSNIKPLTIEEFNKKF
jgi:hypothetical protein